MDSPSAGAQFNWRKPRKHFGLSLGSDNHLGRSLSRVEYRGVAADNLIIIRICEEVPLTDLTDGIRTIEVQ